MRILHNLHKLKKRFLQWLHEFSIDLVRASREKNTCKTKKKQTNAEQQNKKRSKLERMYNTMEVIVCKWVRLPKRTNAMLLFSFRASNCKWFRSTMEKMNMQELKHFFFFLVFLTRKNIVGDDCVIMQLPFSIEILTDIFQAALQVLHFHLGFVQFFFFLFFFCYFCA